MEDKKKVVNTTITRNTSLFSEMTGNIYETVAVLTKRANQIAAEEKKELHNKIEDFRSSTASRWSLCAAMSVSPNPHSKPPRSTSKATSTIATPPRKTARPSTSPNSRTK